MLVSEANSRRPQRRVRYMGSGAEQGEAGAISATASRCVMMEGGGELHGYWRVRVRLLVCAVGRDSGRRCCCWQALFAGRECLVMKNLIYLAHAWSLGRVSVDHRPDK